MHIVALFHLQPGCSLPCDVCIVLKTLIYNNYGLVNGKADIYTSRYSQIFLLNSIKWIVSEDLRRAAIVERQKVAIEANHIPGNHWQIPKDNWWRLATRRSQLLVNTGCESQSSVHAGSTAGVAALGHPFKCLAAI